MLTAEQVAAKWQQNLAAAGPAYQAGVQAVQTSPTQLAAAQADKYARNVQASVTSGRFANKLQAVSLQSWQNSCVTKGMQRLTGGAAAAKPKVSAFMSAWLPVMAQASATARALPKNNLEDALNRVRIIAQAGKAFAGKPTG